MLTYKEFRKKLLTELEQREIKFEITSMTSVNGEKERISIAFSNFTTDNAVDSDHKPETFGLYPDHEYANYLGLCESESESPIERIVDDALQIMSQLSEKVSLEYVNSLLKLRDEDIIYQLINAKKNEELLKKVPHRIVADDLAVIYRIYKTEIDENSDEKLVTSTIILNSVMEESRYTEEKLYACASVNMPKQFPIFILNVQQSEIFSLLVNGFGYSLMDAKEKVLSMPLSNPDTDYMWAMSACYTIELNMKFKSPESMSDAVRSLQEYIKKDAETDYDLESYAADGIGTENIDDLMKIFLSDRKRQRITITDSGEWKNYSADFNASYGWESVLVKMFKILGVYLANGSQLDISIDNDYNGLVIRNGICKQINLKGEEEKSL